VDQEGLVQHDRHVAEVTHLMSRAARWPDGLRRIVRRTKPSRRQARNLTAFERATGWRYSIIFAKTPAAGGIPGVRGSHHAEFIDVLHRQHAVVEDGARAAESMGLSNLPSFIFSSPVVDLSDLRVCVVDTVVHGLPAVA
jgi:hypothetical protein